MSKGLKALKAIKHIYYYDEDINNGEHINIDLDEICKEELDTIESELKEYKKYKLTEKELGIDLNIFIKCLTLLDQDKFTYVYWCDKKKGYFMEAITPTHFLIDMEHKEFIETRRPKGYEQHLKFKDYGKKWALTKEELL